MSVRLATPNEYGGNTDHSEEIALLRAFTKDIMEKHPAGSGVPRQKFYEATMAMAAAALLESHDETGGSLDNWEGPRELVQTALVFIDRPDAFVPNNI